MIIMSEAKLRGVVDNLFRQALNDGNDERSQIVNLTEEVKRLKKEKAQVKEQLAELQKKKELEKMEIEHLVKMKEEKNKLELDKERVKMQGEFQDKTMGLLKENHKEAKELIINGKKDLQEIYGKILTHLPNVNWKIHTKTTE